MGADPQLNANVILLGVDIGIITLMAILSLLLTDAVLVPGGVQREVIESRNRPSNRKGRCPILIPSCRRGNEVSGLRLGDLAEGWWLCVENVTFTNPRCASVYSGVHCLPA